MKRTTFAGLAALALALGLTAWALTVQAADATYSTAVYLKQGAAEFVIASGGTLTLESGGALAAASGSTSTIAGTLTVSGTFAMTSKPTITISDTATNTVADALDLKHDTSGTPAAGLGTGLTFFIEDAGNTEEQASIDAVLTTATNGAEMADLVFSINSAGAIQEALRIVAAEAAATADNVLVTGNTAETNGIVDLLTLKVLSTGTGASGLGAGLAFQVTDAGDTEEQASLDVVLTTATNAAEMADLVVSLNSAGAIQEVARFAAAEGATTADNLLLTGNTAETNGIVDLLTLKALSTGTGAAGMGVGISLQANDAGGAEEQASIDAVLTTATNGAEMADLVLSLNSAGVVQEVARFVAAEAATTSDRLLLTGNTAETDGVVDVLQVKALSTGTGAAGMGVGISLQANDAGGAEEQASIDAVLTTATDSGEMADLVVSLNSAGVVQEVGRFIAAEAPTTADKFLITGNTSGTNLVVDVLQVKALSTGTGANGMGVGISLQANDAGGAEEQASIDAVLTTATNGSEMADLVFSVNSAGAIQEIARFVAAEGATTADNLLLTGNTAETNGIVDVLTVKALSTGTGAAGLGAGLAFQITDAGDTEEQASIDAVLTTATNGAEMADLVFSINSAGAIQEALRIVAAEAATTADNLMLTANTAETDGVVDVLTVKVVSTGTGAAGLGAGLSIQLEDAGDTEEQASLDFALTDATNTTEDCDWIFSANVAGTITEWMRFDADDTGAMILKIGSDTKQVSVDLHPSTTARGTLRLTAADSAGDTVTLVTNASQSGARTYTIPDAGQSAEFLMSRRLKTKWTIHVMGTIALDNDGAGTNGGGVAGGSGLDLVTDQYADGAGTVYVKVYDADMAAGTYANLKTSATLTCCTANYQLTPDAAGEGVGDALLIGYAIPFAEIAFNDLATDAGALATWGGDGGKWQYWSGAAWTDLTVHDNTDATAQDGKRPLARTGAIHWVPPADWAASTIDTQEAYWVRWVFTAAQLTQAALIDTTNKDEPFVVSPNADAATIPYACNITRLRLNDYAATLHTTADIKFVLMNFTKGTHSAALTFAQDLATDSWDLSSTPVACDAGDVIGLVVTQEDGTNEMTNVALELDVTLTE